MSNPAGSEQPREGLLIEQARERMKISQNEAAQRAGISGTRWRQIVYGRASEMVSSRGIRTIARMATIVGVTAEQLAEVDREDIANAIRTYRDGGTEPTLHELAEQMRVLREEVEELRERDRRREEEEAARRREQRSG